MKKSKNYCLYFCVLCVHTHTCFLELKDDMVIQTYLGILYCGTKKLIEYFFQSTLYFARLYRICNVLYSQEHIFCLAVEYLINLEVPKRAQYIRVILLEVTRILNPLLVSGWYVDVLYGGWRDYAFFFYLEERGELMEFYDICIL